MRDNVPGCALMVFGMAVVCTAIAILNQTQQNEERQRLGRMRTVLAVITDKGIATYEHRDTSSGKRGDVVVERRYWIRFQCQVGGSLREGSRLSLFPLDEATLWNSFETGKQYEAHYDPDLDECILVIDEPPGGMSRRNMTLLVASGGTAALALLIYFATRRRRAAGEGTPEGPAT